MDYRHSDKWVVDVSEHDFSIEVVRWSFVSSPEENNWNVYAYLRPKHPLFKILKEEEDKSIYSDSLDDVPFHGRCTLRKLLVTEGHECIKIGSDYQHYLDYRFRQYKTKKQAQEVFYDADELAKYLIAYGTKEPCSDEQSLSE